MPTSLSKCHCVERGRTTTKESLFFWRNARRNTTVTMSSFLNQVLLVALLFSSLPAPTYCLDMPPLDRTKSASAKRHTSQFQARQNHPTSYDDSPAFRGPLKLVRTASTSSHHIRIRNYYDQQGLVLPMEPVKPLSTEASTNMMLQAILDQLAYRDAPVDVKELAESMEFYLRTRKRLLGAASKQISVGQDDDLVPKSITVYDLCSGHGLTGMLFAACNPQKGGTPAVQAMLVDQTEPPSHQVLRTILTEVCPWLSEEGSIRFSAESLDSLQAATDDNTPSGEAALAISTHACGSLTDQVLQFAVQQVDACGIAVMPCCYTGTDKGAPYGIKRALGVSWAADIRRSFYLMEHGYHSDFSNIPSEITPMNRIVVGEKRA
jgi:hypothetical protein